MPKIKTFKALSKKVKISKKKKVLRRATSQNHYNSKLNACIYLLRSNSFDIARGKKAGDSTPESSSGSAPKPAASPPSAPAADVKKSENK